MSDAYVQLMGGKHRVIVVMPKGQKATLATAYSSKASAEQAIKTYGLTLITRDEQGREFVTEFDNMKRVRS